MAESCLFATSRFQLELIRPRLAPIPHINVAINLIKPFNTLSEWLVYSLPKRDVTISLSYNVRTMVIIFSSGRCQQQMAAGHLASADGVGGTGGAGRTAVEVGGGQ